VAESDAEGVSGMDFPLTTETFSEERGSVDVSTDDGQLKIAQYSRKVYMTTYQVFYVHLELFICNLV
jgi:hypothetical protein